MEKNTEMPQAVDLPPQEDHPDEPKKVLKLARYFPDSGPTIQRIAVNRWYAEENAALLDLADDLALYPKIQAVGVVDADKRVSGVIVRKDLFELLGRPFGRDVLKKESIARAANPVKTFFHDANVFTVCEEIGKLLDPVEVKHFPLRNSEGEFAGIFSSQDLLLHLADMSQKDIRLAETIQKRLSQEFVSQKGEKFHIVSGSFLSKGVGGDYCNISSGKQGQWYVTLCDTSSRGLRASLASGAVWSIIQNADRSKGLVALVKRCNEMFYSTFQTANIVSGVFAEFDPRSGKLLVCDQAHGHSYLIRNQKLLKMKTSPDSKAIGVNPEIEAKLVGYNLEAGDCVVFASDGFVRHTSRDGQESALANLKTLVSSSENPDLELIGKTIFESFKNRQGHNPQRDDASFVLVRYQK